MIELPDEVKWPQAQEAADYSAIPAAWIESLPPPTKGKRSTPREPRLIGQERDVREDYVIEPDQPANVEACITWLATEAPVAFGRGDQFRLETDPGGNDTTYRVACEARDRFALSRETLKTLMLEHYNGRCSPPWSEGALGKIVWNACTYAQNEPGSGSDEYEVKAAAADQEEDFQWFEDNPPSLGSINTEDEDEEADDFPRPIKLGEFLSTNFPPPRELVKGYVPRNESTLFNGDPGVGKTTGVIDLAVCVALGKRYLGQFDTEAARVLLVLGEDHEGITQVRCRAALKANGVLGNEADELIEVWTTKNRVFTLAEISDQGKIKWQKFYDRLDAHLETIPGALVVLDSLADIAMLEEAGRLGPNALFKKVIGKLIRKHDATFVILGHPSKASKSDGSFVSGSTAFLAAVRSAMLLEWDDETKKNDLRHLRRLKVQYGPPDIGRGVPLRFEDGVFRPRDAQQVATEADDQRTRQRRACVQVVKNLIRLEMQVLNSNRKADGAVLLRKLVIEINNTLAKADQLKATEVTELLGEEPTLRYEKSIGKKRGGYRLATADEIEEREYLVIAQDFDDVVPERFGRD
jgi:RecA-family ATPase